jgi:hypothetical protein
MFSFPVMLVSTSLHSLFLANANDSYTGISFLAGLLLLAIGTAFRRKLPSVQDASLRDLPASPVNRFVPHTYIESVSEAVAATSSRRHASAV